ncbi:MAG: LysR family transcriptional regulator [Paracoccus sp. (in: a-proteobacteria)]|uniref:LysR family transcriptional regulator n=1 Tax=Paracoccus sp. TaxID=267 RepID=UPI0030019C4A
MDIAILRTFVAIIDEGSFAAAARRMSISKSLCSKHVSDLEADLGARLLHRTTRSVTPTAAGQCYANRVRDVLARLDEASEAVRALSDHPVGPVKIGSPIVYTLNVLRPHLLRFIESNPHVQLEVMLDDGRSDIIAGGFDAVIRIGHLPDSALTARKLHEARIVMVASPGYVAEHGAPEVPADLTRHRCLHYSNLPGSGTWPLQQGKVLIHQRVRIAFASNNSELLRMMAIEGRGIALLPLFALGDELETGALVPLMPDHALPDVPVSLVYPSRRLLTAAMRSFLDFTASLRLV